MNGLLDYFESYNKRIFPLQAIMAVVAIALVGLLFFLPGVTTTILFKAFLSITFGWIGVAFLFLMGDMRKRIPAYPSMLQRWAETPMDGKSCSPSAMTGTCGTGGRWRPTPAGVAGEAWANRPLV